MIKLPDRSLLLLTLTLNVEWHFGHCTGNTQTNLGKLVDKKLGTRVDTRRETLRKEKKKKNSLTAHCLSLLSLSTWNGISGIEQTKLI